MGAAAFDEIVAACERLRRLPASRWQLPPMAPLGSRPPDAAMDATGPSLEVRVRGSIAALMDDDADARGVPCFEPTVGALALPDVLLALALSVAVRGDADGQDVLAGVADTVKRW